VTGFLPAPGQIVTVFRSRLHRDGAEGYEKLSPEIDALARSMPGLIDAKSFVADDGERVTIVTFADEESQRRWRDHPEHAAAQARGRSDFYAEYTLQVGRIERAESFRREPVSDAE